MKRLAVLYILVGAMAMSCAQTKYPNEVAEVNKLSQTLDSASQLLASTDTTGYAEFKKSFGIKLSFVENHFKQSGDTIDRDLAFFLKDYRILKKPYRDMKGNYEQAAKDITFTEKQLITLKYDLENNILEEKSASTYLANETAEVSRIMKNVKRLASMNVNIRQKAVGLEASMDSVINVLKTE